MAIVITVEKYAAASFWEKFAKVRSINVTASLAIALMIPYSMMDKHIHIV